jgi:biopolymer transport protein ExbB
VSVSAIANILIVAAQPAAGSADLASSMQVTSVWDFVVKGGVMMVPICLCSLIAVAVVSERLVTLGRQNVIPSGFLPGLKKLLSAHPHDKDRALAYCKRDGSPVANVFAAGIKRLGSPLEVIEKQIQEAGEREVIKLRKFVRVLSVIAAVAPLMGLLGTIFGMIRAFQTVAMSGEALGKAELLAEGIYEAMITTAAGLCVAIPVLICYHWISSKIEKLVMEIDQMGVDFVEQHVEGVSPGPSPAAAGTVTTMPGETTSESRPAGSIGPATGNQGDVRVAAS